MEIREEIPEVISFPLLAAEDCRALIRSIENAGRWTHHLLADGITAAEKGPVRPMDMAGLAFERFRAAAGTPVNVELLPR